MHDAAAQGLDDATLRQWIGRSETVADTVTPTPVAALSATLDDPIARPPDGTPLPPLWHWLYFLPLHRQSEIGPDGHATRGGFLPPVPLPRRMWAGSQLTFHASLRVGDRVVRTSTIDDVTVKHGRSGTLAFVKVRHVITRADAKDPALTEFHDIVFREAAVPGAPEPAAQPAPDASAWRRRIVPDDVLLFRYSALTFNGHRIHYDRRYVTEVEGYPGLIVHGPLLATLLLELVRRERPQARVAAFEFRARRPVFDLRPFDVCGAPSEDGREARLWIRDPDGMLAMEGRAALS
jgi:3-methylfumaryl-CoA hydratase